MAALPCVCPWCCHIYARTLPACPVCGEDPAHSTSAPALARLPRHQPDTISYSVPYFPSKTE